MTLKKKLAMSLLTSFRFICILNVEMTTGMELDPVFVRALRLLHSKSKDSASQLKAMVDDCLRQVIFKQVK